MKPILFNTDMVKAILDGRKTCTRRVIKFPDGMTGRLPEYGSRDYIFYPCGIKRPPYKLGDILYVRETFCVGKIECGELPDGREAPYVSQCTGDNEFIAKEYTIRHGIGTDDVIWKPSIHMPKSAARIFLRVTDVRGERLQDITWQESAKEGCSGITDDEPDPLFHLPTLRGEFQKLWDSTIKKSDFDRFGWDANPWVWVIEFEKIGREEAMEVDL